MKYKLYFIIYLFFNIFIVILSYFIIIFSTRSLGVMFYEMLFGKCPYEGRSIASLISLIEETPLTFDEIHPISDSMKKLLKEMLSKDPQRRIEWERLYSLVMDTSESLQKPLEFEEKKRSFPVLNVNIPQGSPRKIEQQAVSLDNTPSIEMNPASFHQTLMNLNNEQAGFSKPFSQSSEKEHRDNPLPSLFSKGHTFTVMNNDKISNPFLENSQKNCEENTVVFKNRDSLHSSFHKSEKNELIFAKIYKIEIKHAIFTREALLKFFTRERNKILFLSRVFHEISLYKLMSPLEVFSIYFHKFIYFHARNFKEMLIDHVSLDVINVIANYNDLCKSFEYKQIREIFKEEMDKIIKSFLVHKEKITGVSGIDKLDIDALNSINLKSFFKFVLDYIYLVKENFLFAKEEKFSSEDAVKYMIHAIETIDCLLLNELFDNFIAEDVPLQQQRYFLRLRTMKFTGLLKILNHKIDYFKKKYSQQ